MILGWFEEGGGGAHNRINERLIDQIEKYIQHVDTWCEIFLQRVVETERIQIDM